MEANYVELLPCRMFNFGKPKTVGDWIIHLVGAMVALSRVVDATDIYLVSPPLFREK
jgi:uncharacterized membrane protein YecN with MAPEG domain